MSVPHRGRDDIIFGAKEKRKDVPLTAELQSAISSLDAQSSAEEYKCLGNACFSHGNFTSAIRMYSLALERGPASEVLLSNRSAAYLQSPLLAGPSLALKDAESAISLRPDWFKGYLRKGDALFAQGKFSQALEFYSAALDRNPACSTAQDSARHCKRAMSTEEGAQYKEEPKEYCEEHHRAERARPATEGELRDAEKQLDTETLIRNWSRDTEVEKDRTARKKANVSLDEADRQRGVDYKVQLLSSFRRKVSADDLRRKSEAEQLRGDGVDYRRVDEAKRRFERGTDGVGLAISAESMKWEKGQCGRW
jgi:tetratricopeptide (TPR) repeat protein